MGRFLGYQYYLAALLGLVGGLVFFDRMAINFLSPFILKDLKLSHAELGVAASVVSLSWAMAGYLVGRRSDRTGRRKSYLVAAIIGFSLCSMASGLAGGFAALVLARLAMGAAEGPVMVLTTVLIMAASAPDRRGLNNGIAAFGGGVIGVLAPLVMVSLATHLGWRAAFFVTGIPGLLAAAVVFRLVKEPATDAARSPAHGMSRSIDVLKVRNVWLCALISSLLVAGVAVTAIFTPLFLVDLRHLTPIEMGVVMSAYGLATMIGHFILPALSDRAGRKPVVTGFAALGAAAVVALYWAGPMMSTVAIMAAAGLGLDAVGLSIGIIPTESVADRDRGTAMGLAMGTAEIAGGFAAPALAGVAADHFGLTVVPSIAASCILAAALLSLGLRETAPRRRPGTRGPSAGAFRRKPTGSVSGRPAS